MYTYLCVRFFLLFLPVAAFMIPLDRRHVIIVLQLSEKDIPWPSRQLWPVTLLLLFV